MGWPLAGFEQAADEAEAQAQTENDHRGEDASQWDSVRRPIELALLGGSGLETFCDARAVRFQRAQIPIEGCLATLIAEGAQLPEDA